VGAGVLLLMIDWEARPGRSRDSADHRRYVCRGAQEGPTAVRQSAGSD
jgi:hypothetical protein